MNPGRTGTLRFLPAVLGVIGVSLLAVAAWRRLLNGHNNADPVLVALVATVVVGVFVAVFWWSVHCSRARQLTIATLRPGWQLHGVWANESLSRELITQGVWDLSGEREASATLTPLSHVAPELAGASNQFATSMHLSNTVVGASSVATGTDRSVMGYGAYSWLSDQFGPSSPSTLNLK